MKATNEPIPTPPKPNVVVTMTHEEAVLLSNFGIPKHQDGSFQFTVRLNKEHDKVSTALATLRNALASHLVPF